MAPRPEILKPGTGQRIRKRERGWVFRDESGAKRANVNKKVLICWDGDLFRKVRPPVKYTRVWRFGKNRCRWKLKMGKGTWKAGVCTTWFSLKYIFQRIVVWVFFWPLFTDEICESWWNWDRVKKCAYIIRIFNLKKKLWKF